MFSLPPPRTSAEQARTFIQVTFNLELCQSSAGFRSPSADPVVCLEENGPGKNFS